MAERKWVGEGGSAAGPPAPVVAKRKNRERLAWGIAGVLALVAAAATVGYVRRAPNPPEPVRASILPPPGTIFDPIDGPVPASPHGRQVAVRAKDPAGCSSR